MRLTLRYWHDYLLDSVSLDAAVLSYNWGHRTVRYTGNGGIPRERVLPTHTIEALDEYLTLRAGLAGSVVDALTGPLFATTGTTGAPCRLDEPAILRLIRRLAGHAGLPNADQLSLYWLRHGFATTAREQGSLRRRTGQRVPGPGRHPPVRQHLHGLVVQQLLSTALAVQTVDGSSAGW